MTDLPHATLVLMTYNQQGYVREALRSVLAQSGGPYAILISDDASTDGTVDILRTEIAAYGGPHQVTLRENPQNLGIVPHFNLLFDLIEPGVFVYFAGDDIAWPGRVQRLLAEFATGDPLVVHSGADCIDDQGQVVAERIDCSWFSSPIDAIDLATKKALLLGASAAYHTDVMRRYGPIRHLLAIEDLTLGFRAALEDRVRFVPDDLLNYRIDVGVTQRFQRGSGRAEYRAHRLRFMRRWRDVIRQRTDDARKSSHPQKADIDARLRDELTHTDLRIEFLETGFSARRLYGSTGRAYAQVLLSEWNHARKAARPNLAGREG